MNKKVIIKIVIIILLLGIIITLTIVNQNNKNTKISKQETNEEQLTETDEPITLTLLWENASPSSNMAADTTITLSSDDYVLLLVQAKVLNTHDTNSQVTATVKKGESVRLMGFGYTTGAASAYRGLGYVNDTTYNAGKGWLSLNGATPVTNNAYIVPTKIYGIK